MSLLWNRSFCLFPTWPCLCVRAAFNPTRSGETFPHQQSRIRRRWSYVLRFVRKSYYKTGILDPAGLPVKYQAKERQF